MADFKDALDFVLDNEGGYSNNPNDSGGETNFGLSAKFLRAINYNKEIKKITVQDATAIYKTYCWEPYYLGEIESKKIASKIFDCIVNMGPKNAISILQKACNDTLYNKQIKHIVIDGIIGTQTITTVNTLPEKTLLDNIKDRCVEFYKKLVEKNPTQKVFLTGWLKRAIRG